MRDLFDTVADHIREVSADVIEPRWRVLEKGEVDEKSGPDDLVTVADLEAERELSARLAPLLPGSAVVGEEAVGANPKVLDAIGHDAPVWIIDPIDGTGNFVAGSEEYGVMVALVERGTTTMAWIYRPTTAEMVGAERGAGAYSNTRRLVATDDNSPAHDLAGVLKPRFLDNRTREAIDAHVHTVGPTTAGTMCAAVEYEDVANNRTPFIFFWLTNPWDHAPGALIVEEAGGRARRLDGSTYEPASNDYGLLVTTGPTAWRTVRTSLLAGL